MIGDERSRLLGSASVGRPDLWIALLIAIHLVPIWIVERYPSQDGASHLFQAWALHGYASSELLREHFVLNLTPFPNWGCYALLQPLLAFAAPATAEKLLLTLYVVAFPLSYFWLLDSVHPGRRLSGFVVFAFVFNYSLQLGLYSFCLGVPLCFYVLGSWWRHRDALGGGKALALGGLLVLTYLAQVDTVFLTLAALGILALVTARRANFASRLRLCVAVLPVCALLVWYLFGQQLTPSPSFEPTGRIAYLVNQDWLVSTAGQRIVGWLITGLLGVLAIVTVRARLRPGACKLVPADAFVVVSTVLLLGIMVLPNNTMSGGLLIPRISLFTVPLLLVALAPALVGGPRRALIVALVTIVALQWGMTVSYVLRASRDLEEFVSGLPVIERKGLIWPVTGRSRPLDTVSNLSPIVHAGNWYAIESGGVNVVNYHATSANFPVLERRKFDPQNPPAGSLYLIAWDPLEGPGSPLPDLPGYDRVFVSTLGHLRIFRRR